MSYPHTQRVLITGANGFVGQNLLSALSKFRYDVYTFNSSDYTCEADYTHTLAQRLREIPPTLEYVVHLGAISDSGYDNKNIFMANTVAAAKVAEAALQLDAKFIFFSSCAAIAPMNLYGWSKRLAEDLIRATVPKEICCILRPYNIYAEDESMKSNPSLVYKIANNHSIPYYNDFVRDFIHVTDVCRAVLHLMSPQKPFQPGTYDLGTGRPTTPAQLYALIKKKQLHPDAIVDRPLDVDSYIVAEQARMLKNFYVSPHLEPYEAPDPV